MSRPHAQMRVRGGVSVMFEQIGPDPQSDCFYSRKKKHGGQKTPPYKTASYVQHAKVNSCARRDEAQLAASD